MKRRLKVETAKQVKVGSGADGLMPPISPPVLPSTGATTSSWSRNRHRLYVAPPPPQHACTHLPRPGPACWRLQRRRWRALRKMGTRMGRWRVVLGRRWHSLPLPALPRPLPDAAWAPLESNLQSDTHTQRGRVWGRAPKRAKKEPLPRKTRSRIPEMNIMSNLPSFYPQTPVLDQERVRPAYFKKNPFHFKAVI